MQKDIEYQPPEFFYTVKTYHALNIFHPALSSSYTWSLRNWGLRESGYRSLGEVSAFSCRRVEPEGPGRVEGMLSNY